MCMCCVCAVLHALGSSFRLQVHSDFAHGSDRDYAPKQCKDGLDVALAHCGGGYPNTRAVSTKGAAAGDVGFAAWVSENEPRNSMGGDVPLKINGPKIKKSLNLKRRLRDGLDTVARGTAVASMHAPASHR